MQPKDVKIGQTVTIFKRSPLWSDKDANMLLGKTGKITNIFTVIDTSADLKLGDGSTACVNVKYLELTPTEDQIKIGAKIKIATDRWEADDYVGATGTITKICSNVDDEFVGLYMQPDDPELASEYILGIYLHGLNRFTIIEEPNPAPSMPMNLYLKVYITGEHYHILGINESMTIQECKDSINRFLESVEKEAGDNK